MVLLGTPDLLNASMILGYWCVIRSSLREKAYTSPFLSL
jgi:hypothetical protein